jgi:hypothetical protein
MHEANRASYWSSVAYDAGIISPQFYTALVVAAVLTPQAACAWLDYVLRKGWPLLMPLAASPPVLPTATQSPSGVDCGAY